MAKRLQLRKGTATEHNTFTGANGEVTVDTTNKTLRVHDGSTVGGTQLATLTGGLVPVSQLPDATTTVKGAVILNNTLTSTNATQALTAAQGKVLADQAFGSGQTWQDVTASRQLDVTYTNSTGKPITVIVSTLTIDKVQCMFVDDIQILKIGNTVSRATYSSHAGTIIVPVGSTFKVTVSGGYIETWFELR